MFWTIIIIWVVLSLLGGYITGGAKVQAEEARERRKKRAIEEAHQRALELAKARRPQRLVHNHYTQVNIDKAVIMKGENDDEPYRIRTYRRY